MGQGEAPGQPPDGCLPRRRRGLDLLLGQDEGPFLEAELKVQEVQGQRPAGRAFRLRSDVPGHGGQGLQRCLHVVPCQGDAQAVQLAGEGFGDHPLVRRQGRQGGGGVVLPAEKVPELGHLVGGGGGGGPAGGEAVHGGDVVPGRHRVDLHPEAHERRVRLGDLRGQPPDAVHGPTAAQPGVGHVGGQADPQQVVGLQPSPAGEELLQVLPALGFLVLDLAGAPVVLGPAEDPPVVHPHQEALHDQFTEAVPGVGGVGEGLVGGGLEDGPHMVPQARQAEGGGTVLGVLDAATPLPAVALVRGEGRTVGAVPPDAHVGAPLGGLHGLQRRSHLGDLSGGGRRGEGLLRQHTLDGERQQGDEEDCASQGDLGLHGATP